MAKYEEVFEDTQDLYTRLINEASLNHVNITILADNKAKEIIEKTVSQAHFVSINDFFCNNEGCLIYIGDNPKSGLTSFDDNHLSPLASDQFAKERLIPLIFSTSEN